MVSRPRRTKSYLAKFLLGLWLSLPPTVDAQSATGLKAAIDGVKLDAERRRLAHVEQVRAREASEADRMRELVDEAQRQPGKTAGPK